MEKTEWCELLRERGTLLLDSAMGTALIALDLPDYSRSEAVNMTYPDEVTNIHRANIEAGSDIITSNTFGISSLLAEEVRGGDFNDALVLLRAGVECARRAADSSPREILVILDIGPTGKLVELSDDLTHEEAYRIFEAQAAAGAAAGADLILIETMSDPEEMKDALKAALAAAELPVFCTMTFDESGRSFMGADPASFAKDAEALGASAIGANCLLTPVEMAGVIAALVSATSLPVIAQPNAGQPVTREGKMTYDMSACEFAEGAKAIADAGASIIGGCCGSRPEFIAMTKDMLTECGKRKEI